MFPVVNFYLQKVTFFSELTGVFYMLVLLETAQ